MVVQYSHEKAFKTHNFIIGDQLGNIFFFIAGGLAALLCVYLPRKVKLPKLIRRSWEKIENINFQSSFDFEFTTKWAAMQIIDASCQALVIAAGKEDFNIFIDPGQYTITADINIRFVKR